MTESVFVEISEFGTKLKNPIPCKKNLFEPNLWKKRVLKFVNFHFDEKKFISVNDEKGDEGTVIKNGN